jgi:tRNA pseudouridine55 synthase
LSRRRDLPPRVVRRIDGVLLLNKPRGISSNGALQRVKRLYQAESAGHTGTLDPLASGLLPICLGDATKFGGELLESDKRYLAVVRFGETTATGDAEGPILEARPVDFAKGDLETAMQSFRGEIAQIPPMYSALKHHGQPLYELARKGQTIVREARHVFIRELALVRFEPPLATLDVLCSKGTYIRTLAEDLGQALGCGAHLASLERTGIGPHRIAEATELEALEQMPADARDHLLMPMDSLVRHWPAVELSDDCARRFTFGQAISRNDLPENAPIAVSSPGPVNSTENLVRVYSLSGAFLGLGQIDPVGSLRPHRLVKNI